MIVAPSFVHKAKLYGKTPKGGVIYSPASAEKGPLVAEITGLYTNLVELAATTAYWTGKRAFLVGIGHSLYSSLAMEGYIEALTCSSQHGGHGNLSILVKVLPEIEWIPNPEDTEYPFGSCAATYIEGDLRREAKSWYYGYSVHYASLKEYQSSRAVARITLAATLVKIPKGYTLLAKSGSISLIAKIHTGNGCF